MLYGPLLLQLGQFFLQPAAAQLHLLGAGSPGRKPRLEFAELAVFVLTASAQLFTLRFQVALLSAQVLKVLLQLLQTRLEFELLMPQAFDFLATGQNPALGLPAPADPQKCRPIQYPSRLTRL